MYYETGQLIAALRNTVGLFADKTLVGYAICEFKRDDSDAIFPVPDVGPAEARINCTGGKLTQQSHSNDAKRYAHPILTVGKLAQVGLSLYDLESYTLNNENGFYYSAFVFSTNPSYKLAGGYPMGSVSAVTTRNLVLLSTSIFSLSRTFELLLADVSWQRIDSVVAEYQAVRANAAKPVVMASCKKCLAECGLVTHPSYAALLAWMMQQ